MANAEAPLEQGDTVTVPFTRKKGSILHFDHPDIRLEALVGWPDGERWTKVDNLVRADP